MAFPDECGGLPYSEEEAQVITARATPVLEPAVIESATVNEAAPSVDAMRREYFSLLKLAGIKEEDRHHWQRTSVGKDSLKDWDAGHYDTAFACLEGQMLSRFADQMKNVQVNGFKFTVVDVADLCQYFEASNTDRKTMRDILKEALEKDLAFQALAKEFGTWMTNRVQESPPDDFFPEGKGTDNNPEHQSPR